jgi:hypothetical protein
MIFKVYEKCDPRWSRVETHPLCVSVPNVFTQILYTYKDEIPNLREIDSVIETGTYQGNTAEIFAEHFNNVYTVEKYVEQNNDYCANESLIDIYKALRAKYKNINFYSGDSASFLQQILSEQPDTRFVILLDAHTHGSSPVIQELNSIRDYSNIKDHVIIIDDAIDVGTAGWPDSYTYENAIREINSDYNIITTGFHRKTALIYS